MSQSACQQRSARSDKTGAISAGWNFAKLTDRTITGFPHFACGCVCKRSECFIGLGPCNGTSEERIDPVTADASAGIIPFGVDTDAMMECLTTWPTNARIQCWDLF